MEKNKKGAIRFFACCMAILLVCTIFIWGFQSSWGRVKIERIYLEGENGTTISSLIYIPDNATDDNPAPVAVILHGRSNHAHSNDTWSLELARRGFVVLSPDLQGGGESDPSVDRGSQAITVAQYANSLSFVEKDKINLIGYSAGTATVLQTYNAMPDSVNSICEVFGPFMMQLAGGIDSVNTNYCMIKSTADQYDGHFIGNIEECREYMSELSGIEDLQPDTDYDWRGAIFRYSVISGTLHQTGNISGATITAIVDYEMTVNQSPVEVDASNQVWVWQQIFSAIACVTMMFLLASIINLLMQMGFFAKASNPVPVKPARAAKGWDCAKAWIIDFVFTLVIPALIFVHVSAYVMKWTGAGTGWDKVLTSTNLNGIMGWLIVIAIIGIIRMIVRSRRAKKEGISFKISDYSLGGEDEVRIDWRKPATGLLIGIIAIVFVFTWLWIIEGFAGINYQIWNLSTYLKISPMRIVRAIPYVLIIFFVMFVGNMNQRILPSTGNQKKDLWIAVAVNTCMTASALFVLLLLQYGGSMIMGDGSTIIPQIDVYGTGKNTSCGALDYAFGYCYMMGGTTGVVTYIYRKYGNIWLGVIPAAIFAGLVTLSGFTIVA